MLHLRGRASYREAPELRRAVFDAISVSADKNLVVELGEVETIDTAALAVLVEALMATRDGSPAIFLMFPSDSVLQVLLLAALQPALVVQAVYAGNDFGDLLRNKLFRIGVDGELIETPGRVVGPTAARLRWSRYTPVVYKVVARAYYNWSHKPSAATEPAVARARQVDEWL